MAKILDDLIIRISLEHSRFENSLEAFEAQMTKMQASYIGVTMGLTSIICKGNHESGGAVVVEAGQSIVILSTTDAEMVATTKYKASDAADTLKSLAMTGNMAEQACAALPDVRYLAQSGGLVLGKDVFDKPAEALLLMQRLNLAR